MLSFIAAQTAHTGSCLDDHELLNTYLRANDREALSELFRRHADLCYRVAHLIVNQPALAEAAVWEAFQQVMEEAAQYTGGEHVRAWLLSFVIQAARKRKPAEASARAPRRTRLQLDTQAPAVNAARI